MKRHLSIALVLCMILTLAGCSQKSVITGYKSGDVTLGQYKGITYVPEVTTVLESTVDERITANLLVGNEINYPVTDRTVVDEGDIANIDFVGRMNGETFSGGTGYGVDLTIGSNYFIPGFEEQVIGMKIGETKTIEATFPENYGKEELNGKTAQFDVTVNGIFYSGYPELTDEFVSEQTDGKYNTVNEYRAFIFETLEAENEVKAKNADQFNIFKQVIENATFNKDLSEQIYNDTLTLRASNASNFQNYYGVDAVTFYNLVYGMTEEEYNEYTEAYAKMKIKYAYVLSAIVEAENITVTDEDVEALTVEMMETYGYENRDAFFEYMSTLYGSAAKEAIEEQAKINKALDIVVDSAVEG